MNNDLPWVGHSLLVDNDAFIVSRGGTNSHEFDLALLDHCNHMALGYGQFVRAFCVFSELSGYHCVYRCRQTDGHSVRKVVKLAFYQHQQEPKCCDVNFTTNFYVSCFLNI